jgi:hypothetical protein
MEFFLKNLKIFQIFFQKYSKNILNISHKLVTKIVKKQVGLACVIMFAS